MKTLQNNFTTPEQSKRLLELGVPILTADCYYYVHEVNGKNICDTPWVIPFGMGKYGLKHWWADKYNDRYMPCWSAGRLLEIIRICNSSLDGRTFHLVENMCDSLMALIEIYASGGKMDLSKLKE